MAHKARSLGSVPWGRFLLLILALIVLAGPLLAQRPALGAPNASHTVNDSGDQNDANTGDGVCDVDLGTAGLQCTLRAAIEQANASNGPDLIEIDWSSVPSIMPGGKLPSLNDTTGGTTIRSVGGIVWVRGLNAGADTAGFVLTSDDNKVQGLIISDFDGEGVRVTGDNNFVGTDGDGTDDADEGNCICDNGSNGVDIRGSGNRVAGNSIGTNVPGTAALPNEESGVMIWYGGQSNVIGTNGDGVSDGLEGNVISGNLYFGVTLHMADTMLNVIAGNHIGTNAAGDAAIPNAFSGVSIWGPAGGTLVGTNGDGVADDLEGNVISGNGNNGILIESGTENNVIAGNCIGTNAAGDAAIPNRYGILARDGSTNNTIGTNGDGQGDTAEGNIISGNSFFGVYLEGAEGNVIAGNYIGTNADGMGKIANGTVGVYVEASSNTRIGGTQSAERNVISGNGDHGIHIHDSTGAMVQGNIIGLDVNGVQDLGNDGDGVDLSNAADNLIGGVSGNAANHIAYNGGDGVYVLGDTSTGNKVVGNNLWANDGLGIDLHPDGVTPNDPGDADSGANGLQNYPLLSGASSGIQTTITGTLNSQGDTPYVVNFYANSSCDPSGYGEGERFLGNVIVTTDAVGDASFVVTLPGNVPAGHFVVATATDSFWNTSEFCACVTVVEEPYYTVFLPVVFRE
jgi:parallel beta-helix repeat protein